MSCTENVIELVYGLGPSLDYIIHSNYLVHIQTVYPDTLSQTPAIATDKLQGNSCKKLQAITPFQLKKVIYN